MRLVPLLALTAFALPHAGPAATYHVAQTPNASDQNAGTASDPWKTIARAVDAVQPGDTVLIHEGTYREWVAPRTSGTKDAPITFQGVDRDKVVLTGADLMTDWKRAEGHHALYRHAPWNARFPVGMQEGSPVYHHPADQRHTIIGRSEQVIVDGKLLDQVLTLGEMKPGTFAVDLEANAIYVWLTDDGDPQQHQVEASTRGWVFGGNPWSKKGIADHIRLRNVTIRYAANHAQRGALYALGDGWRVDRVTVEWTNGCGATFAGSDIVVRSFCSQNNGQMGMGGNTVASEFANIELLDNNRKGYDAGWEAGGMKFTHCRDTVFSRVEAARNDGPGIWFDIDNRDCVVRQCVCHDNTGHGIFVEISGGFVLTNNLCYRNGSDGNWASGGICIGESNDCLVEHNTCVANPTGISVREQGPRTFRGRYGEETYHVRNFVCQYNLCAFNTKYQFGLWSDNIFFGPHPSATEGHQGTPLDPTQNAYRIEHNLYFPGEKQGLVLWGCPWRNKHKVYADLKQFAEEQGHDGQSVIADPLFVDAASGDFRLREESPASKSGSGTVFLYEPKEARFRTLQNSASLEASARN